ncbi:LuxR C-terminal-related transcriptional regulator [Rhizobium sp. RAF36]|uniref:helix-turn-helix transcriptional regulator n=1 Tax=Rhizobium sp. RAF36 TaxID=3233055 RepID=UPI003F9BB8E7
MTAHAATFSHHSAGVIATDIRPGASSAGSDGNADWPSLGLWEAVASATVSVGSGTFYDRLLDILGALVRSDLLALVRYSSFGAPDLIIPRENRIDVEQSYNGGLYKLDPFHHYWLALAEPTVASLRNLAPAELWESSYALDFLRAADVSDEIALFLPPIGGASPTLILDRATGTFTEAEVARVRSVYPLVASLHNAHIEAIISKGVTHRANEKPFRMLDRCGRELAANDAWRELIADPQSGLADVLRHRVREGAFKVQLPDGRTLTRSNLAADFGAAPEGMCDEIEIASTPSSSRSSFGWLEALTQREREIVILTLEGHPIASIAKRLGLQCGTVKNHRLRLYQKLDITTERELFLMHMRYIQGVAP